MDLQKEPDQLVPKRNTVTLLLLKYAGDYKIEAIKTNRENSVHCAYDSS